MDKSFEFDSIIALNASIYKILVHASTNCVMDAKAVLVFTQVNVTRFGNKHSDFDFSRVSNPWAAHTLPRL